LKEYEFHNFKVEIGMYILFLFSLFLDSAQRYKMTVFGYRSTNTAYIKLT